MRGQKHVVKRGKTPMLTPGEARLLLNSIDVQTLGGLRDRALIGVMVYSFARVSAVVGSDDRLSRADVFKMIKRRAAAAGLGHTPNCHTFRATSITAYLLNGGSIEDAQAIAAHESTLTTKLYDRRSDEITLNEIERIVI